MKQSQLFTKTLKTISKEEISKNAQFLTRGGFIYKNSAGVYTYLPLGLRVIERIAKIIREEMNLIGGVEMLMPALVDKKYMQSTKRWNKDVGFKVISQIDLNKFQASSFKFQEDFVLGWTHEEVIAAITSNYVSSYRDLPFYAYQIQTKFRNEKRVKSGLLRGREFMMKDLYSFHANKEDLLEYYDKVKQAYFKIFERCGLKTIYTLAPGGDFTEGSTHEFQVLADVGEDTIFYCSKCKYAENKELSKLKDGSKCFQCDGVGKIKEANSIEVGNIFPLGTKYSEALNLKFKDEKGKEQPVVMGSYGIGLGRLMPTVVEKYNDSAGIIWPKSVAPFRMHLIEILSKVKGQMSNVHKAALQFYDELVDNGIEVLYDERDMSAGEKFADADLIGIPLRIVVSEKSLKAGGIEVKMRNSSKAKVIKVEKFLKDLKVAG